MTDFGLSTKQLAVICALSSGATLAAASEEAGVHRNTINNWRRNDLPFQHALSHAQYDRALYFREKMEDLVDLALDSLQQILADPNTPSSVRLKAALAILQTAATPPAPRKEVLLDIEQIKHTAYPDPITAGQLGPAPLEPVHNPAQPAAPKPQPKFVHAEPCPNPITAAPLEPVNNPAQPAAPKPQPKVGRNEPCPCGSGLKYKRCCLNHPVTAEDVQRLASAL